MQAHNDRASVYPAWPNTAGQFVVPRLSTRRYAAGPSEGEKEAAAPSTGQTFNQSPPDARGE
jgi:hypothetical protein